SGLDLVSTLDHLDEKPLVHCGSPLIGVARIEIDSGQLDQVLGTPYRIAKYTIALVDGGAALHGGTLHSGIPLRKSIGMHALGSLQILGLQHVAIDRILHG